MTETNSNDAGATSPLLQQVNRSGYPLQLIVKHIVEATKTEHQWKVRHFEHAWANAADGQSGFIDLAIHEKSDSVILVIECKRVLDMTWIFLPEHGQAMPRKHSKAFVAWHTERRRYFGWDNVTAEPLSPEAVFCTFRAEDRSTRPMLERVVGELISSTEALAQQEKDLRPRSGASLRFYFNALVTTAQLQVAEFDASNLSMKDGTLTDAQFKEVPFVRFRKQFSAVNSAYGFADFENFAVTQRARENSAFIVNVKFLESFLHQFWLPQSERDRFPLGVTAAE